MEKENCTTSLLRSESESMDSSKQSFGRLVNSWVRKGSGIFTKKNIAIISGPLACFMVVGFVKMDEKEDRKSRAMMGALCWIFIWWLTDAVPVAVTSLAPLYLFPLLKISKADAVAKSYMNDVISLVIGSFILALAVEHYNMHKRLALKMLIAFSGETSMNPRLLLLGLGGATAFVSMWMHNVAAAVLMMPVGTGILQRVIDGSTASSLPIRNEYLPARDRDYAEGSDSNIIELKRLDVSQDVTMFCKAVVLAVLYAAAIGGMSTLTGTGVNLILVGMWQSYFPSAPPITFMKWSLFAFPMSCALFLVLWGVLCVLYCSKSSTKTISALLDKSHLKRELQLLGPMPFADKMVLSIFMTLVILWMTQSLTNNVPGWGALFDGYPGDGTASVMMATLLFIIPSGKAPGEKLMDWNKCKKLPWNVVLLLGAGFAIADSVRQSGLAGFLSKYLKFLERAPYLAIAPIVAVLASTLTEFTSNNATTTLFVPLLIQAAESMHAHPLLLMIPGAIGAQFSFLLPTGTPSNAVGFTTGYIDMKDMLKTGILLKFAGIVIVSFFMPTLGARVFGTNASP